MKKISNTLIPLQIIFSFSCSSQDYQEKKTVLNETKNVIKTKLDSANYYFDLVIDEYSQGVENATLIKKYGKKIEQIETGIDQALEKTNKLVRDGILTEKEYQTWMNEIDLKAVMEKHDKISSWGIDFKELPVTNYYSLVQSYSDTVNNFSVSFPAQWTIMPAYNGFTLMGAGPLKADSSSPMRTDGGFGLNIEEYDENFSTEEYYRGNLKSIRNAYADFVILEEKDINLNGIHAKYIAHRCTLNGKEITSIQIYLFENKKGYVLNGSATLDEFEDYRDLYIEIARTLKLSED